MLLALPAAPPDSRERVAALLADYLSGQEGRIAEIMGYAGTGACRHGYISAYFGGLPIERCRSCDNCLGTEPAAPGPACVARRPGPDLPVVPGDAKWAILKGVDQLPYPLGAPNVARALVGADTSRVQADNFPLFGILAGRSQKSVLELIDGLLNAGLLAFFQRGDYRLIGLTDQGRAWLAAHPRPDGEIKASSTQASASAQEPARRPDSTLPAGQPQGVPAGASLPPGQELGIPDEDLLERLRAWRSQVARQNRQPAFMILPNSTLLLIAATQPATLSDLLAIKGIGERKAQQYGPAVLDIVAGREPGPVDFPASMPQPGRE
jgi:superfamily II DNA helicase RecQ